MKKIVAFLGSPRKEGFSNRILEQVLETAKEQGAEVTVFDLNDPGIKGCQGCLYCRGHHACATQDALQAIYEPVFAADALVVSAPIYFGTASAQVKTLVDRLFPVINPDFSPRYPGKKVVTVFAQATPNMQFSQAGVDATNAQFRMLGWDVVKSIVAMGTSLPGRPLKDAWVAEAVEAGKMIAE